MLFSGIRLQRLDRYTAPNSFKLMNKTLSTPVFIAHVTKLIPKVQMSIITTKYLPLPKLYREVRISDPATCEDRSRNLIDSCVTVIVDVTRLILPYFARLAAISIMEDAAHIKFHLANRYCAFVCTAVDWGAKRS